MADNFSIYIYHNTHDSAETKAQELVENLHAKLTEVMATFAKENELPTFGSISVSINRTTPVGNPEAKESDTVRHEMSTVTGW